jgi:hypothetical protein
MKEIKHYYQETSFGCGPASLLIAYRALGLEYNEVTLTVELGTDKDGTGWDQMFAHVREITKFPVELRNRATYEELKEDFEKGIIIVGWTSDGDKNPGPHFSVASGILDDLIELTDPGSPEWPTIMAKEEFISKWFDNESEKAYLLIKPKTA